MPLWRQITGRFNRLGSLQRLDKHFRKCGVKRTVRTLAKSPRALKSSGTPGVRVLPYTEKVWRLLPTDTAATQRLAGVLNISTVVAQLLG